MKAFRLSVPARALIALLAVTVGGLVFASCKSSTETAASTYNIVPPSDASPHGHTWADWLEMWAQWRQSMPDNHNPLTNTAPDDTLQNNTGHNGVYFLGGIAVKYPTGADTESRAIVTRPMNGTRL